MPYHFFDNVFENLVPSALALPFSSLAPIGFLPLVIFFLHSMEHAHATRARAGPTSGEKSPKKLFPTSLNFYDTFSAIVWLPRVPQHNTIL